MNIQEKLARLFAVGGTADHSLLGLTGVVLPFAGATAPTGWLMCTGQAVSRTTYADLFAIIGTTYGTGNGSTTFTLPDLRGRVIAGADNMGGTAAGRLTTAGSGVAGSLGATGGAETHTLAETQIPAHTHTGTAASGGAHTHDIGFNNSGNQYIGSTKTSLADGTNNSAGITSASSGAHTHTLTLNNTGGGTAHNNTQPTCCLNYIIKA